MTTEIPCYISESVEVSSTTPLELDVVKRLGRSAEVGWITSDDGDVHIQINDRGALKITLHSDETLVFEKDYNWSIKNIYITTSSALALTVRYLLKYLPIIKVIPLSREA